MELTQEMTARMITPKIKA